MLIRVKSIDGVNVNQAQHLISQFAAVNKKKHSICLVSLLLLAINKTQHLISQFVAVNKTQHLISQFDAVNKNPASD